MGFALGWQGMVSGKLSNVQKTSGWAQLGVKGETNDCSISDSYCQHLLELMLKKEKVMEGKIQKILL